MDSRNVTQSFVLILTLLLTACGSDGGGAEDLYTLQNDETLESLALAHYGDAQKWPAIWLATNIEALTQSELKVLVDPKAVAAPDKVKLPVPNDVESLMRSWTTPGTVFETKCWEATDTYGSVGCGYLVAPEDHSRPSDIRTVQIAFARVKSTASSTAPDPVFLLAGGPGVSGVLTLYKERIFQFLENRDVILIDQRGMGHSQPGLFCNDGELTDECRARLVGNGVDLSQFHTAAIADDIELLRQSLGLDQINLFGFSYGTFLGQEILRRHPERIRSAVLDSCLPVAVATTAEGGPGALASFLNLIADCNSDPACRASYPEIENTLYAVLDRANTTPFEILLDGETVSAGPSMLVTSVFMALNSPSQINAIPKAIYDLAAGDMESTALATVLRSESNNMPYLDSQGAKISVKCHDILPFETYIEAKQNNASLNPYIASNYDLFALTGHTQCQVWQVRAADASFHYPVQSDVPTLVLGGEYDSLTRSAWSETVAATLSQSYYFSIPRTGHVTIQRDCPLEMAKSFLNNPSAVPNSSCLSEITTSDFFELPSS